MACLRKEGLSSWSPLPSSPMCDFYIGMDETGAQDGAISNCPSCISIVSPANSVLPSLFCFLTMPAALPQHAQYTQGSQGAYFLPPPHHSGSQRITVLVPLWGWLEQNTQMHRLIL